MVKSFSFDFIAEFGGKKSWLYEGTGWENFKETGLEVLNDLSCIYTRPSSSETGRNPHWQKNKRGELSPGLTPGLYHGHGLQSVGQLPVMQTNLSACLIYKQRKTSLP